jgi:hypothetical protein
LGTAALADLLQNDSNHLNRKRRIAFNMKAEHTMCKSARTGRATQRAAMVLTGLVAFIWVYFGRLYLIHDPGEWKIANGRTSAKWRFGKSADFVMDLTAY